MATAQPTVAMQTASSPSRSPLRGVLIVAGAALAAAFVAGGAFTIADLASHHSFDVRASYPGVRSLIVDDSGGGVVLTGASAGTRLTVTEHVSEGLTAPTRTAVASGGVLRLAAHCPGFGVTCGVSYAVTVPAGIPIVASSGAGKLTASGLAAAAALTLSTGSGDVVVSDVSSRGALSLTSGDGDITASRITAPRIRLTTGDGDLSADLAALPPAGALSLAASSGDGDVVIGVPPAAYAVRATSGDGDVSDQALRIDPASPLKIDASSGDGDVTIAPRP